MGPWRFAAINGFLRSAHPPHGERSRTMNFRWMWIITKPVGWPPQTLFGAGNKDTPKPSLRVPPSRTAVATRRSVTSRRGMTGPTAAARTDVSTSPMNCPGLSWTSSNLRTKAVLAVITANAVHRISSSDSSAVQTTLPTMVFVKWFNSRCYVARPALFPDVADAVSWL